MVPSDDGRRWPINRVKQLREARRMTQKELAALSGISFQQIGNIERGDRRLDTRSAEILARALNCSASEFLADAKPTVAVRLVAAAAFTEDRPAHFDLAPPHERVQVSHRVEWPDNCVAALVHDDHANRLYPPDSIIVVREVPDGEKLRLGSKVLVRHFARDRAQGTTMEVLVGILDLAATGDLQLLTRSTNRAVPASITIQTPKRYGSGLGERYAAMLLKPETVEIARRDDDAADIIGRVVLAITPEAD